MKIVALMITSYFTGAFVFVAALISTESWWSIAVVLMAAAVCTAVNIIIRVPFRHNVIAQSALNSFIYTVIVAVFYGYEAGIAVGGTAFASSLLLNFFEQRLLSDEMRMLRDDLLNHIAHR